MGKRPKPKSQQPVKRPKAAGPKPAAKAVSGAKAKVPSPPPATVPSIAPSKFTPPLPADYPPTANAPAGFEHRSDCGRYINSDGLSPQHFHFACRWLIHHNATRAYVEAGYLPDNADVSASRLLGSAKVRGFVDRETAKVAKRLAVTRENVLQRIVRRAMFDHRDLYRPDGTLRPPHELDDDTAPGLAGVEYREMINAEGERVGSISKYKHIDSGRDLEMLAKHLGILTGEGQGRKDRLNEVIEALTKVRDEDGK